VLDANREVLRVAHILATARARKNLAETIAALREKRGHYEVMSAELERTGEAQISLTDPDSRAMAAHTKAGVGYNIQVAVDAKHKMIGRWADQTATRSTCSGQMQPADDDAATLLISSYGNDQLGTRGCRLREFCRPYHSL
jgi:hypothetical protein